MGWNFLSLSDASNIYESSLTDFDCGDLDVNKFLQDYAQICEQEDFSKVFLMVSDEQKVVGYYTLGNSLIPVSEIPNQFKRGIPNFSFPAVLIGQFGINKSHQGKGLSYLLLGNAYTRIALAYRQKILAIRAVRVDTRDERAKAFWLKQGFIPFKKSQNSLFIPLKTILREFEL